MSLFIYLLTTFLIAFVFYKKNSIFLVIWPYLIYGLGPYLCQQLQSIPELREYINIQYIDEQAFWMFFLIVLVLVFDFAFKMHEKIDSYLFKSDLLDSFVNSKYISLFFVLLMAVSSVIQIYAIMVYGSIASNNYLISTVPFWGVIGGFYEICFLGFFLYFPRDGKYKKKILTAFAISLLIRILSGTRLMAIKAIVFALFCLYKSKKIKIVKIILAVIAVLGIMSYIGGMRVSSSEVGLFDSIFYESAYNMLTYNIAFDVSKSISIDFSVFPNYIIYLLLSIIPSFITNIFVDSKDLIQQFALENQSHKLGYDDIGSIWAFSIFATFSYLSNYIFIPIFGAVLTFVSLLKARFFYWIKVFLVNSIFASSLNLWRDPTGISLKLIVQDFLVLTFLFVLFTKVIKTRKKIDSKIAVS